MQAVPNQHFSTRSGSSGKIWYQKIFCCFRFSNTAFNCLIYTCNVNVYCISFIYIVQARHYQNCRLCYETKINENIIHISTDTHTLVLSKYVLCQPLPSQENFQPNQGPSINNTFAKIKTLKFGYKMLKKMPQS